MIAARGSDPRWAMDGGVLPVVAQPRRGLPGWLLAVALAALAVLLFTALDARRRARTAPVVTPSVADLEAAPHAIAPLYIPPARVTVVTPPAPPAAAAAPEPSRTPPPPRVVYVPQPAPRALSPPIEYSPPVPRAAQPNGASALVIDTYAADPPVTNSGAALTAGLGQPARATVLRMRGTTVAQGTLIPAVLETAFDSTRPGLARALVSADVRGYDGTRVLIPRGSRLIGEYRADLQPGQNRALIAWSRLIRPDGATIALGSPAADALGRGGVKGQVDTHFFARFGAAILQSALDIGVSVASRSLAGNANNGVIVALPGGGAGLASPLVGDSQQIRPTLRVRQGTTISVFVARDLDFTSVERTR